MGLSESAVATARSVILIYVAHSFTNALLLSPLNPLRCSYWNANECSTDEGWICNWFSYSQLHMSVLLGCIMVTADSELVERVGYLICALMMSHVVGGIFCIDLLNSTLAGLQCVVYAGLLGAICYSTYQDPNKTAQLLRKRPVMKKMRSSSSFDQRQGLPVATIAIMMHLLSSVLRVIDMTFGSGREGYKGDMSSPIYQSISNFAVGNMMLTAILLLFCLLFCTTEQHKLVLYGQACMLFITQIMLATWQGDQLENARAGAIGTFCFLVLAIIGAL